MLGLSRPAGAAADLNVQRPTIPDFKRAQQSVTSSDEHRSQRLLPAGRQQHDHQRDYRSRKQMGDIDGGAYHSSVGSVSGAGGGSG